MSTASLQRAVIDSEFRGELVDDPAKFGVTAEEVAALTPVAEQDQELLDFWAEGVTATEIYACASTCSSGPMTILCDGSTK